MPNRFTRWMGRTLLAASSCGATIFFVGCSAEEEEPAAVSSVDCTTHQLRPSRYKLFEIADELKRLTRDVEDPSKEEVYVIPGHWSAFWAAPQAGFEAAQAEMGFQGDFRAPCDSTDTTCIDDQMRLFDELTDDDPDNGEASAIGIGCKGPREMAPLITRAARDIPVITFDSDVETPLATGRQMYLGAMNQPAGRDAAETMFSLLEDGGTVHIYAQSFAPVNLMERAAGVFAVCLDTSFADAAEFAESEYCSELATSNVCEAACTGANEGIRIVAHAYAEELAADTEWQDENEGGKPEDYLADAVARLVEGDEPPAGIISLHGTPSPVLGRALEDLPSGDSVRFVAWDLSTEVQDGLERGTVDASMVQNAYFYGYITAHIAYAMAATDVPTVMDVLDDYFESDSDDKLLDTGMTIVTPSNLSFYLQYQVECLGLTTG